MRGKMKKEGDGGYNKGLWVEGVHNIQDAWKSHMETFYFISFQNI